jgi:putative ABC transport system permease protein
MRTDLAIALRETIRGFVRHKSIFGVAVLTLILGLSLCTTMFCVLYGVILRPLSYGDASRLVVARASYEGGSSEQDNKFDEQALIELRREAKSFDGLGGFRYWQFTLLHRGEPMDLEGVLVSPDFFSVLGARAQVGGVFGAETAKAEQGKVVLLSYRLWRQRFGADPAVVGQAVNLSGDVYTVAGVMPNDFDVPSQEVGVWAPLPVSPTGRPARNLILIGRLRPPVSLLQAEADVDGIARRLAAEDPDARRGMKIHLVPFFDELIKDSRQFVLMASTAALLVLLICCANISNLLLVRAIERRSEFATRLAIGAQRRHLLVSVFTESLLLAVCGGILSAVLARWMIATLVQMSPIELPRSGAIGYGLQIPVITAALILVTALLIALPPALEVARPKRGTDLGKGSRSTSRRFARQLIVSLQLAIALTLLAGSVLMARTLLALRDADPGWKTDHLLASQIFLPKRNYPEKYQIQRFFETFIERLRATPGVASVAASSAVPTAPMGIDFDLPIQVPGAAAETAGRASIRSVTPGFFKTMGIPLLQGRDFDGTDSDPEVRRVMINQSFAKRYFPDAPLVIGKQVVIILGAPATYEVIGVVGDVYHYGLLEQRKPEFYLPFASAPFAGMGVVVRTTGDPRAFAQELRKQLWALDPELPVSSIEPMDQMVKETWSDRTFLTVLMVLFAFVAVALTVLGVFSVVTFSVSRQVREIGIRMALGARRDDVVRLVMGQSTQAIMAGVGLGLVGAWMLGRGLASLVYGVSASDPWVLLTGAVCMALIAGFGAYLPSRRAAKIDPMAALRID